MSVPALYVCVCLNYDCGVRHAVHGVCSVFYNDIQVYLAIARKYKWESRIVLLFFVVVVVDVCRFFFFNVHFGSHMHTPLCICCTLLYIRRSINVFIICSVQIRIGSLLLLSLAGIVIGARCVFVCICVCV